MPRCIIVNFECLIKKFAIPEERQFLASSRISSYSTDRGLGHKLRDSLPIPQQPNNETKALGILGLQIPCSSKRCLATGWHGIPLCQVCPVDACLPCAKAPV